MDNHKHTLSAHAHVICAISPNDHVQMVLGAALEEYQRERKFTDVRYQGSYSPIRGGFEDLARMLQSHSNQQRKRPATRLHNQQPDAMDEGCIVA